MPGWKKLEEMAVLGKRLPRVDGIDKVTGRAKYTYDIHLPGMLYGALLTSPYAHARVKKVDASKAEALPGVRAVFTNLREEVLFAGQEVAAVAAVSPSIAEEALALIDVEYEPLPFVVDEESAMKPGAPRVIAGEASNLRPGRTRQEGDVEKGFAEADVIVEATFRTQVQTHACLEVHGSVAKWDGDTLTVWDSTQAVHGVREQLAQHLGIPQSNVRVISHHMGGGFGSKLAMRSYTPIAARLAKEAGAPVKLMLTREQDFLGTGNRPSSIQHLRAGARQDGTLVAFEAKVYGTAGIATGAGVPLPYIYRVPNVKVELHDVFTNAGPACPMRAPGHPQAAFGMESLMDMLAEKLGMDPLEFRRKNDPHPTRQKEYTLGAERIGWHRRNFTAGATTGTKRRGIGMASCTWGGGGRGTRAEVLIYPDGTVEVKCGTQDIGTGTRTVVAAVAAEELGLKISEVKVLIGDSDYPYSGASGGSTTAASVAPAIQNAAEKAKQKLLELVAPRLGSRPEELDVVRGRILVKGNPTASLSWKEATALLGTQPLSAGGEWTEGLSSNGVAGCQFAEVEVDTETGQVRVLKVVAVHDCGLVIDRLTAESQIHGGVIQGLSYALLEQRILDRNTGRMVNANFEAYKMAGALEIPEIEALLINSDEARRGVIGLGEPPVIPTAAAIANAVSNALGVRIHELPITPDKVLAALAQKEVTEKGH